jgi:hypothetical protein
LDPASFKFISLAKGPEYCLTIRSIPKLTRALNKFRNEPLCSLSKIPTDLLRVGSTVNAFQDDLEVFEMTPIKAWKHGEVLTIADGFQRFAKCFRNSISIRDDRDP